MNGELINFIIITVSLYVRTFKHKLSIDCFTLRLLFDEAPLMNEFGLIPAKIVLARWIGWMNWKQTEIINWMPNWNVTNPASVNFNLISRIIRLKSNELTAAGLTKLNWTKLGELILNEEWRINSNQPEREWKKSEY